MSSQSSGNNNDSSTTSNNNNNNNNNNTNMPQRRGSITEYFRPPQSTPAYTGPITSAAAQANHRRRLSYSSGITGTSPNPAWFGGYSGARRGSISSISSTQSAAIIDDEDKSSAGSTGTSPTDGEGVQRANSFARRLSFGARALRDVKRTMSFGTVGEEPSTTEAPRQESLPLPADSMPPPSAIPAPAAVTAPKKKKGPDEIQERILKGDFYY